jgi:hypothetical protein
MLYWPFTDVATEGEALQRNVPQNAMGINAHVVYVASSPDGIAWSNHVVYDAPADSRVDAVFPWLAVDAGGNVYTVWSNTHGVFLSRSSDRGAHWTLPIQVSQSPVASTVLPTIVGGRAGTVDVAFIGTDAASLDDANALWSVYFAQSLNADTAAPAFTQVLASEQPIHKGSVCLRGLGCDLPAPAGAPGDRALAEILTITLDLDGYALLSSPYDFRGGKAKASTQSVLMKQSGLERAFDSDLPPIGLTAEPK